MDNKSNALFGYCGLYCGNCYYYQNTLKETAEKDDTYCEGCNGSVTTTHCSSCDIKNCNKEKNIKYCLECSDYPCDLITGFINDERYPYHKDVPANMKRLSELGPDAWAKEMQDKYTCKTCGNSFTYYDAVCQKCKKK